MRIITRAVIVGALSAGTAFAAVLPAAASDAHPSPSSSCSASWLHREFRYSTPALHHHDLLQCQSHPWKSGPARWTKSGLHAWRIIGTW